MRGITALLVLFAAVAAANAFATTARRKEGVRDTLTYGAAAAIQQLQKLLVAQQQLKGARAMMAAAAEMTKTARDAIHTAERLIKDITHTQEGIGSGSETTGCGDFNQRCKNKERWTPCVYETDQSPDYDVKGAKAAGMGCFCDGKGRCLRGSYAQKEAEGY